LGQALEDPSLYHVVLTHEPPTRLDITISINNKLRLIYQPDLSASGAAAARPTRAVVNAYFMVSKELLKGKTGLWRKINEYY
jgi:hypothetical protein